MEYIGEIIRFIFSNGGVGLVIALLGIKWKLRKEKNESKRDDNDTIRDNMALQQEILNRLNQLTEESSKQILKIAELEQREILRASELKQRNVALAAEQQEHKESKNQLEKLKQISERIQRELIAYKKKCQNCQLNPL